jgi:hypothetical protein
MRGQQKDYKDSFQGRIIAKEKKKEQLINKNLHARSQ